MERRRPLENFGYKFCGHANLAEELVAIGAPVVKTIDDCLDPERAYELLPGKTRSSTLKRYVTMYKRLRLWLQEAKRVDPPGRPADLIDYLLVLRDEPCARTVPERAC